MFRTDFISALVCEKILRYGDKKRKKGTYTGDNCLERFEGLKDDRP